MAVSVSERCVLSYSVSGPRPSLMRLWGSAGLRTASCLDTTVMIETAVLRRQRNVAVSYKAWCKHVLCSTEGQTTRIDLRCCALKLTVRFQLDRTLKHLRARSGSFTREQPWLMQ